MATFGGSKPGSYARSLTVAALVASSAFTAVSAVADSSPVAAMDVIPDDGLPAISIGASALVSERTEILAAGVTGRNEVNDSFPREDISVIAFAEYGDRIFVGGKFLNVQDASTREEHDQPFLAAFDRETGAWDDSFRPVIDGNVWDLKVTDDGQLIVAGQFQTVNGVANTAGVAMIDPVTAEVHPTWRANLVLTGSTDWAIARTLDIHDGFLYIGGNFTRITGANGDTKMAARLARVDLATSNADGAFLPNIDGVVFDVDADGDRVYAVGNFFNVGDEFSASIAVLNAADASLVPGLEPPVRTTDTAPNRWYQQAVLARGSEVWVSGSQHVRQVYNAADFSLIQSWISAPLGDGQAYAEQNGFIYSGSHAADDFRDNDTYLYQGVTTRDIPADWEDFATRKQIRWMSVFDDATNEHVDWLPQVGTANGEGSWELFADSVGCIWSGGDFNRGSFDGDVARYAQGFVRFCPVDSTPPEAPTDPTATARNGGIDLAWTGSTDDRDDAVRYELLKNDDVFASFISITTFRDVNGTADDRYFVRAMDAAGNRSATTQVFTAAQNDTQRPTTPQNLLADVLASGDVALSWTASSDNVSVVEYTVFRNGVEIGTTTDPSFTVPAPAEGDHYYQVSADDAAGNTSFRTPSTLVTIVGPDTQAPTTPRDLAANVLDDGRVRLTWTASTDDVGVVEYIVFRNGVEIQRRTNTAWNVPAPGPGDHYYQVRAVDAAGNESFKTPSTLVTIAGADSQRPSTPQNLVGDVLVSGDVALTWTASTDDVGVTEYVVLRNGVEIGRADGTSFTVPAPAEGDHYYQVRAVDAAGNESFKTPPTLVTIAGADSQRPSTPQNLVGEVLASGDVALAWTASTDNVGVAEYVVFRNNVEIGRVSGASFTVPAPAPGDHYYQVRALDAAGNESFKTPPTLVTI